MDQNSSTEVRLASRVILIDAESRILFCRGVEPSTGAVFWVMPGGGLDPEETFESAARREVHEETGLAVTVGPCVWHRRHQYIWNGQNADQFEKFFVARVPSQSEILGKNSDSYVTEYRWWSLEEIAASREDFAPRKAAQLLPPILEGRIAEEAFDCGI